VKTGIGRQVDLQKKIRNLKFCQKKQCLREYITEFENSINELKSCGGSVSDSEVVSMLLASMPDTYDAVTRAIDILFNKNPDDVDIQYVKNALMQEELRQVNIKKVGNTDESVVFNTKKKYQSQEKWKSNSNGQFKYNCYNCGKRGHRKSECRYLKNNLEKSNLVFNENKNKLSFFATNDKEEISECLFTDNEISFIVDSGATDHIVNDKVTLGETRNISSRIAVAKRGVELAANLSGNLELQTQEGRDVCLHNVLMCKDIQYNLLSVVKIQKQGYKVIFEKDKVFILDGKSKIVVSGNLIGNFYFIKFHINYKNSSLICDNYIIHRRMSHSSYFPAGKHCDICIRGKLTRKSFKSIPTEKKPTRMLEVVSSDVTGPVTPSTHDNKRYYVSFIDHFSHFTVVYLITQKSEVFDKLKEYEEMVKAKFGTRICRLRCDNGGEYSSKEFKQHCRRNGIQIEYTIPRNPEQNGVSERLNRTLMNNVRCMMLDTNMNKEFWGEAVRAATYVLNRTPSNSIDNGKCPADIWYGYKCSTNNIRVFGSLAYAHIPKEDRQGKLDPRSKPMLMVGYCPNGYRLWDIQKKKIITACSVKFVEESNPNMYEEIPIIVPTLEYQKEQKTEELNEHQQEMEELNEPQQETEELIEHQQETEDISESCDEESPVVQRKSKRTKRLPAKYQDYEMGSYMAALSVGCLPSEIPTTYEEAVEHGWKKAVQEELKAHEENNTWDIVQRPDNIKVIDSKWIFRKKTVNGQEIKKARLVARGFQQEKDDENVYAPVARMTTLRVLIALAAERNLQIHQLDVKSAFLKSNLKEPVYMEIPEGLNYKNNNVCKLKKALYGLRQSSKNWNECLNEHLLKINLKRSLVDPCLYTRNDIYVLIWVDDIILFSYFIETICEIKENLSKYLDIKDLTQSNKIMFLGIEIERQGDNIYISQRELIRKVINHFQMSDCKTSKIPIQHKLNLKQNENFDCNLPYKQLIGSLMYLMLGTRPDLCYAISYFSQFQNNYNVEHWKHLKNTLRYLKETENLSLKFVKSNYQKQMNMSAFVDSDFASNINDRKSVTGYIIKLNDNLVCWKSQKQKTVSLSSCESEYIALASCVTECLFLGQLLTTADFSAFVFPIKIFEDNQSCLKIASTLETKRSKHIDVKHHFLRQLVEEGKIKLTYVNTNQNTADIMTKSLSHVRFIYLRGNLNMV
jgi:transposase InsO family protein